MATLERAGIPACIGSPVSHVTCPRCGSKEHTSGYGFAAGTLGSYTICGCAKIIEFEADTEGLPPKEVKRLEELTVRKGKRTLKRWVGVWYSPADNTIELSLHDKEGWWKWFEGEQDFVHMDTGPAAEKMIYIGRFYELYEEVI